MAWHRKLIAQKYDSTSFRTPGRRRTAKEIEDSPGRLGLWHDAGSTRKPEQYSKAPHLPSVRCLEVGTGDLVDGFHVVSRERGARQGDGRADGAANVSTTLNVHTQVVGDSKRTAIENVSNEIIWPELGQNLASFEGNG